MSILQQPHDAFDVYWLALHVWVYPRHGIGFAAACARLALPFYSGDGAEGYDDLVCAVELCESVGGRPVDQPWQSQERAPKPHMAARSVAWLGWDASVAATTARQAVMSAEQARLDGKVEHVRDAALYALNAGVPMDEVKLAWARWVLRDMAHGADLAAETRQAATAALLAGHTLLARDIVAPGGVLP